MEMKIAKGGSEEEIALSATQTKQQVMLQEDNQKPNCRSERITWKNSPKISYRQIGQKACINPDENVPSILGVKRVD